MLSRLLRSLDLLRPRTIAQLAKGEHDTRQDVRSLVATVKQLERQVSTLRSQQEELLARVDEIRRTARQTETLVGKVGSIEEKLDELALRERQLRAIQRADARLDERERDLDRLLQPDTIAAHVRAAIAAATVHDDPFPYAVVDNLLPDAVFEALIRGLPPSELFADRTINRQQLTVPFELAPRYGRRVWAFMSESIVPDMIAPAMLDRFAPQVAAWLQSNFPALGEAPLEQVPMTCSDGRIMLRRPGYYIRPHRDPKWGFLTCLIYLKRPGDEESWGTDLCRVKEDEEARGAKPHWIDETQCEVVERVAFRRNRALMFLNSVGAHTARIPDDAQPPDLERYAYQFRVGARSETIQWLIENLPAERRAMWAGKVDTY